MAGVIGMGMGHEKAFDRFEAESVFSAGQSYFLLGYSEIEKDSILSGNDKGGISF